MQSDFVDSQKNGWKSLTNKSKKKTKMAVRKSKEETFSVKGNTEEWFTKAEQALHKGGFANVKRINL